MKKYWKYALMATLSVATMTITPSCSDDDDDKTEDNYTISEEQAELAEKLIGTWEGTFREAGEDHTETYTFASNGTGTFEHSVEGTSAFNWQLGTINPGNKDGVQCTFTSGPLKGQKNYNTLRIEEDAMYIGYDEYTKK